MKNKFYISKKELKKINEVNQLEFKISFNDIYVYSNGTKIAELIKENREYKLNRITKSLHYYELKPLNDGLLLLNRFLQWDKSVK